MSSEKRDPKKQYGNTVYLNDKPFTQQWTPADVVQLQHVFDAVMKNAKESLPPKMFKKVVYSISWKYTP